MFLRNIGRLLPEYTASHHRRLLFIIVAVISVT
jgi:hypothetical protein